MEVSGTVKVINPEQQISPSFKKRELVITTDEQYPQHILIEFTQDRTDLLDHYTIGDAVKVSINLRGREWANPEGVLKYFNTVQGWRIEKVSDGSEGSPTSEASYSGAASIPPTLEGDDDLPF